MGLVFYYRKLILVRESAFRYNQAMPEQNKTGLSLEPYKGVRDFYPADMAVQNYIFDVMRKTVESFGYTEYSASILEPAELYRAKSSEEIVNEQTYAFIDRGGREITLRPEMTPTVARMVAAKKRELSFPLRWYSVPNLFRYERPQRGRLREHWQLNVDMFGLESAEADIEIISIAHHLLKAFGLKEENFEIKINNRTLVAKIIIEICRDRGGLTDTEATKIIRTLDKRGKISDDELANQITELAGKEKSLIIADIFKSTDGRLEKILRETEEAKKVMEMIARLRGMNIQTKYDGNLMRGFDYYTGTIFEVFDTNPQNNRSLFGGGRYDDLLTIFGQEKVPAVGFGMGDVTIRDVLETYNLIPDWVTKRSKTDLAVCTMNADYFGEAGALASRLRERGLNVAVDYSGKKISDQIKKADRDRIPFIVCIGEEEITAKIYKVKELSTGKETVVNEEGIPATVKMNNESRLGKNFSSFP